MKGEIFTSGCEDSDNPIMERRELSELAEFKAWKVVKGGTGQLNFKTQTPTTIM
jgi:hypothetical protein